MKEENLVAVQVLVNLNFAIVTDRNDQISWPLKRIVVFRENKELLSVVHFI